MKENKSTIDEWFDTAFDLISDPDYILEQKTPTAFSEIIFNNLPDILRTIVASGENGSEKSLLLFCSIVLVSGVLPNYETKYDDGVYESNLCGYIVGPFGSGKGKLVKVAKIIEPIDEQRRALAENLRKIEDGKFSVCRCESSCNCEQSVGELSLILAGNTTKSALHKFLKDNFERGMIIESEADTLTVAISKDHGSFKDSLRKCSEHEPISSLTRQDGNIRVNRPCLTVAITSTPKQLRRFISDVEDGLFSRFLFFKLASTPEFKNVFRISSKNSSEIYESVSVLLDWLYNELLQFRKQPIEFHFTEEQQIMFVELFGQIKAEYMKLYGDEMVGVVHRLGVMFTRISMILTMVRIFDFNRTRVELSEKLYCSDIDFETVQTMVDTFIENSESVYLALLNGSRVNADDSPGLKKDEVKVDKTKRIIELFKQGGYSHRDIAELVLGDRALQGSVHRILKANKLI